MNQRTIATIFVLSITASGLLGGCAKNPNANRGKVPLNTPVDEFGSQREPDVTAETHIAAGRVAESREDLGNAILQYEAATQKSPKSAEAWYLLASTRARATQYDASISAWHTYIKLVGNDASAYANLGFTYDLARKFTEAEKAYRKGIEIDPKNKAARTNYGLMLAKSGRIDDARRQFAAVLPPAAVQYNIASVYEQQGKTELARAEYQAALKTDPKFTAAKSRLDALKEKSATLETK